MDIKLVLADYFSKSNLVDGEMKEMNEEKAKLDAGKTSVHDLLKKCVENRHFHFLHLRKDEKEDFVNRVVESLVAIDVLHRDYDDFEQLYETVKDAVENIDGIGDLMLYDITRMIGYALNPVIVPQALVYLCQGAKEGAKSLLKLYRLGKFLPIESFAEFFPDTESQYIEDILCIYKENFKTGVFTPNEGCKEKKAKSCKVK